MRIRTIKPEFWRSPDISSLSIEDRLLFIGLWSYVDDEGRGEDRVATIAADLFADDLSVNPHATFMRVHGGLMRLAEAGRIVRYTVDERDYLYVVNWKRHQRINRPQPSKLPDPDEGVTRGNETFTDDSVNTHGTFSEGSLPGTGEQRNRGTEEKTPHSPPQGGDTDPQPPMLDPVPEPEPASEKPVQTNTDRFDEFWDIYPRRVAKQHARKAWNRAVKHADPDTILAGTRRYATERANADPRYTAHPATWLNGHRWTDEPQQPPPPEIHPTDRAIAELLTGTDNTPTPAPLRALPGGKP